MDDCYSTSKHLNKTRQNSIKNEKRIASVDVLLVWSSPHGAEPPCAQVAERSRAGYHRQVRDKHQPLSLCDTVSGCHGQIADGSSLQVSTRVRPEAEAESNLISETMTWLCARARPRACTEHNPWTAAGITQAHITVRCGAGCVCQ